MDLSGESLAVQIGDDTFLTNSDGLGAIPRACEDNCSVYHDIFPAYRDVTAQVSLSQSISLSLHSL